MSLIQGLYEAGDSSSDDGWWEAMNCCVNCMSTGY